MSEPKPKKPTQDYQKALEYFKEVCIQDSFKEAVLEIQRKYFPDKDQWVLDFDDKLVVDFDALDNFPNPFEIESFQSPEMKQDTLSLLKRFELPLGFYVPIWYYVFYGLELSYYFEVDKTLDFGQSLGLIKAFELPQKLPTKDTRLYQAQEDLIYPLAIKFSPYVTKRDLLDYVDKQFDKTIKPLQEKYINPKSKMGKFKSKDSEIAARNEYIYELRDNPRKEIARIIKEVWNEYYDVGTIGKIISIEEKRRKEL